MASRTAKVGTSSNALGNAAYNNDLYAKLMKQQGSAWRGGTTSKGSVTNTNKPQQVSAPQKQPSQPTLGSMNGGSGFGGYTVLGVTPRRPAGSMTSAEAYAAAMQQLQAQNPSNNAAAGQFSAGQAPQTPAWSPPNLDVSAFGFNQASMPSAYMPSAGGYNMPQTTLSDPYMASGGYKPSAANLGQAYMPSQQYQQQQVNFGNPFQQSMPDLPAPYMPDGSGYQSMFGGQMPQPWMPDQQQQYQQPQYQQPQSFGPQFGGGMQQQYQQPYQQPYQPYQPYQQQSQQPQQQQQQAAPQQTPSFSQSPFESIAGRMSGAGGTMANPNVAALYNAGLGQSQSGGGGGQSQGQMPSSSGGQQQSAPRSIYNNDITQQMVNQAAATSFANGDMNYLMKQFTTPGVSHSAGTFSSALPQFQAYNSEAGMLSQMIPMQNQLANAGYDASSQYGMGQNDLALMGLNRQQTNQNAGFAAGLMNSAISPLFGSFFA